LGALEGVNLDLLSAEFYLSLAINKLRAALELVATGAAQRGGLCLALTQGTSNDPLNAAIIVGL
jgi:hypothetical protein